MLSVYLLPTHIIFPFFLQLRFRSLPAIGHLLLQYLFLEDELSDNIFCWELSLSHLDIPTGEMFQSISFPSLLTLLLYLLG